MSICSILSTAQDSVVASETAGAPAARTTIRVPTSWTDAKRVSSHTIASRVPTFVTFMLTE